MPTVGLLLGELDKATAADTGDGQDGGEHRSGEFSFHVALSLYPERNIDWEKTSLKPYIDYLDKHVAAIMAETRQAKREMGA